MMVSSKSLVSCQGIMTLECTATLPSHRNNTQEEKVKFIMTLAAAVTVLATGAFAQEFTKGTVKKVDAKAKKVTLIHEELKNLDMPAMTMVFSVSDPAMLDKLKTGANVEFMAERVDGKLTVTQLK